MNMNDVEEIINNSSNYIVKGMEEITIGGITLRGFSKYQFMWEVTTSKQPERAPGTGYIGNLDTISAFASAHAIITYDIMPITEYRKLRQYYLNETEEGFIPRKHFTATMYDSDYDRKITRDMYLATPNMPEYYIRVNNDGNAELIGVRNYIVELIDTNRDGNE